MTRSGGAGAALRAGSMASDFYLRYYVGHKGKFGHEFLEFEFRPDGEAREGRGGHPRECRGCGVTCVSFSRQGNCATPTTATTRTM